MLSTHKTITTVSTFFVIAVTTMSGCSSNKTQTPVVDGASQAEHSSGKQQWRCEADDSQQQWRCSDLATSREDNPDITLKSALATQKTEPSVKNNPALINATAATATATVLSEPALAPTKTNQPNTTEINIETLLSYPDDYLVVQLIAGQSLQTINSFKQLHPQLATQQLTLQRDGKLWYYLIIGPYPNYRSAEQAIESIEPPLKTAPWIRPLAPIKKSLGQQQNNSTINSTD